MSAPEYRIEGTETVRGPYRLVLPGRVPTKKNKRQPQRTGPKCWACRKRMGKLVLPRTKEYERWLPGAVLRAKVARAQVPCGAQNEPLRGDLLLEVTLCYPDRRVPDSLNVVQSVEDMLQRAAIVGNDRDFAVHHVYRFIRPGQPASATVRVEELR